MAAPNKRTPAQAQWQQFRDMYDPHYILAFRMGDFFEFFHDDARAVSRILDITCTDRQGVPLAGFPYASGHEALEKIVKSGRPVVVVDQVEDPAEAKGRVVDRDIVRVITPGTILDDNVLDRDSNNYMASLSWEDVKEKNGFLEISLAFCDVSTGDFFTMAFLDDRARLPVLKATIGKHAPVEIIIPDSLDGPEIIDAIKDVLPGVATRPRSMLDFDPTDARDVLLKHFGLANLEGFGIENKVPVVTVAGALIRYMQENQKATLSNITTSTHHVPSSYLQIDHNTIRNLEILQNNSDGGTRGTLFELFRKTATNMGTRLVKRLLLSPFMDIKPINDRLDLVEVFINDTLVLEGLRDLLSGICDLERLISRINYSTATNARHLLQLGKGLQRVPALRDILGKVDRPLASNLSSRLADFDPIVTRILATIVDEPPVRVTEGCMIRDGVNAELDELRGIRANSQQWLEKFQETMRQKYGLTTLRVKSNDVFGYFIEISKNYVDKVPDTWTRKQTLVNAERYINPELKEMEEKILSAEGKIYDIEKSIFTELKAAIVALTGDIQATAKAIAEIDAFVTFASVSASSRFVRPVLDESGAIHIKGGRHPTIEKLIGTDKFITNDLDIDPATNVLTIVTGPNMSGKSTFLRQVCLIAIMAQAGCFVPASSASIGVLDKIFSRVGAQDDISRQRSTFLLEMNETAYILNHATSRSLVILDELGRGTSTFDGVSLAWAVAEYLQAKRVKTMFATHYHQLSDLESFLPRTKNLNVLVKEDERTKDLVFLHKVVEGSCDRSYGIQVAKLAGVPLPVINRAQEILKKLTEDDPLTTDRIKLIGEKGIQSPGLQKSRTRQTILMPIVQKPAVNPKYEKVEAELARLNPDAITPIEALNILKCLKDLMKE